MLAERPPPVLVAAFAAVAVALLDAVDVATGLATGAHGRIAGTLLRDALLVAAAVATLRRAAWGRWTLVALFALGLLRTFSAAEGLDWAGVLFCAVGLAAMLAPGTRAWFAGPPAREPDVVTPGTPPPH